jgi:valyl-tRNA synthetase
MPEEPTQRPRLISLCKGKSTRLTFRSGTMAAAWICLSARGARAAFLKSAPVSSTAYGFRSMARAKLPLQSSTRSFATLGRSALVRPMSTTTDSETAADYDVANQARGLDKYNPSSFESEIYAWWEESGCFLPDAKQDANGNTKQPYVLPMPPPNVTGRLHMGHAIFVALQDILARFHRMRGRPVLWLPGTDHAGIATQLQVEKQLIAAGTTREEVGREAFLEKVWEYKEEQGGHITRQLRALGASADWTRERFTMDQDLSDSVSEAFVRLHEKGLVYRGEYMVNWAPLLKTAVSDLEVEYTDEVGKLYFFKYMVEGSDGKINGQYEPISLLCSMTCTGAHVLLSLRRLFV